MGFFYRAAGYSLLRRFLELRSRRSYRRGYARRGFLRLLLG